MIYARASNYPPRLVYGATAVTLFRHGIKVRGQFRDLQVGDLVFTLPGNEDGRLTGTTVAEDGVRIAELKPLIEITRGVENGT